jgi:hypothetical protein
MNSLGEAAYKQLLGQLNLEDIYVKQAFEYYNAQFMGSETVQHFVETSSVIPAELKQHEYIGLCDRTLGMQLSSARTIEGGVVRGHYQHCGLFIPTGGELFRGCVVFPERDNTGQVVSAVGYRFGRVRDGQSLIIHWQKPALGELIAQGINNIKEVAYGQAYN